MAAYGALVSVMQIMDQIHRHPHPPISLHKEQVESLTANVTFVQEVLEGYNPQISYTFEADPLESRIAEAAYAAEDVIESYIVDQIRARSTTDDGGSISSSEFYQGLEKVIEEMDLIKLEVMEMKDNKKMQGEQIKQQSTTEAAASSRSSSSTSAQKVTTMVGLDEVLYEMLDKITGGERARQIIPIVGMGGLGKTSLARNIYANPLVKEHFDICAWSTVSQVHKARKILMEILGQVGLDKGGDLSDYELGEKLYRHLIGRRYLVVMDDMWSVEAWDVVRSFFPDNENSSRVVVTTRLSNLASMFDYSDGLDMKFLNEASSWNLFSRTVFGDGIFPPELKDIGEEIVKGCRGLPLSIVVVGGLLSKSEATRENWKVIEENLSSLVNMEEDGSCLQTLYMSYDNLPAHMKPCFLYMGVFPEDEMIPVHLLIPIWVAEGFIKPIEGKSLEEAAKEYLEELVDRNLVLVEKRNRYGKLKACKMHDLLRDLALREAKKNRFLCVIEKSRSDGEICSHRHIVNLVLEHSLDEVFGSVEASSPVRALIGIFGAEILPISRLRLLRVLYVDDENIGENYEEIFIRLLNLRFLVVFEEKQPLPKMPPPSVSFLWNIQTLLLFKVEKDYVLEIWKMPLLRIAMTDQAFCLPDPPPPHGGDEVVLENLHILMEVKTLNLTEDVLKRIPNINVLKLHYDEEPEEKKRKKKGDYGRLNFNFYRLNNLQDLRLKIKMGSDFRVQDLMLPYSLKKLTLDYTHLPWEEMASKIGCLPLLQVLKLKLDSFIGYKWETVEGQFSSLKYLLIDDCSDLEYWITDDNTHFPRLEHLILRDLDMLREIPSCIGDVPTLRSIELKGCSVSAEDSTRRIQEEQEEYGNEHLQIQVK